MVFYNQPLEHELLACEHSEGHQVAFGHPQEKSGGVGVGVFAGSDPVANSALVHVVVVLAVEGGHQRDMPLPGDVPRRQSRQERRVGVHQLEGRVVQALPVGWEQPGKAEAISEAAQGHAVIQQRLAAVILAEGRIVRRDIQRAVAPLWQVFAVGQHHLAHAVQIRGIYFAKLPCEHVFHLRKG